MGGKATALKKSRLFRIPDTLMSWARRKPARPHVREMQAFPLFPNVGTAQTQTEHKSAVKLANDWLGGGTGDFNLGFSPFIANYDLYFPGYQALALLTQKAEFRRPAEIIAKTMTRNGFSIITTGKADKSKKIADLEAACRQHKILNKLRIVAEQDGNFGRSQIYIDTGNVSDDEITKPLALDKAKVQKGGKLDFRVIEPMWSYPAGYNSTDPLGPDFYRPAQWYVMQKAVHETRLLTFVSRPVPDILKPAYMFGGLSLSQMGMVYVENWLKAQQHVSDLIRNFSTSGVKTAMGNLAVQGASEKFQQRMELFNLMRDNGGFFVMDKDTEEFFNVSTPLSGLHELVAQTQEHQATVFGIPVIIFFGLTPNGFNASTDGEFRAFYDWCHAMQEQLFTPHLETMLGLIQLTLFGAIDPEIHIRWNPLWQLDEAGMAAVQKSKADTDAVLIGAQVIDPEEARTRLASDDESPYHGIKPDDLPEPMIDPNGEETPPNGDPGGNPAKNAEPRKVEQSAD